MAKFEIRKAGRRFAHWEDAALTPPPEVLCSMKAAGYRLYIDGRQQR